MNCFGAVERESGRLNRVFDRAFACLYGNRFGALDLGHQPGVGLGITQQLARQFHVGGITREGNRDIFHLQLGREVDIGAVLVGQRSGRQAATAAVDALVVGQRAAGGDAAAHFIATDTLNLQHHAAVIKQQLVAGAAVLDQIRVVQTHDVVVAVFQPVAGGQAEVIADLK